MSRVRTSEHNGALLVSVTSAMEVIRTVLGEKEYHGHPDVMRAHMQEGNGCHSVCLDWLVCGKDTPLAAVMPIAPDDYPTASTWPWIMELAWTAFRDFCAQYQVELIAVEQECTAPAYGLMGHPDLVCWLVWKGRRIKAVIDLKFTAGILKSHYLQVRCYAKMRELSDVNMGFIWKCSRATGAWKLEPVPLNAGLRAVVLVSCAAQLWIGKENGDI